MAHWTDQFVGDRMQADQEFADRVESSEFSSQEWGTIMTAVSLEIENPDSPSEARLVADTSRIDHVMPALEDMRRQQGAIAGGGGGGPQRDGGGLLDAVKSALGLEGGSGGGDAERIEAAESLADEYASLLQQRLEREGKWERACQAARDDQS